MELADKIHQEAQRLPEPLAREVLDFIGYLEHRHGLAQKDAPEVQDLKAAQQESVSKLWDNPEDKIWNDL